MRTQHLLAPLRLLLTLGAAAALLGPAAPASAWDGAPGPQPPAPNLEYSLFLGTYPDLIPLALAVGPDFSLYIAGSTDSRPRPDGAPFTGADAFVARLSPDGRRMLALTYLAGSGDESAYDIAVDARGAAYIVGQTNSADLPTVAAAQAAYAGAPFVRDKTWAFKEGDGDAFVARLEPDGRTWRYLTYLGGSATDLATAIAVGSDGRAAVAGTTRSADFPVLSPLQPAHGGGADAFVAQLSPTGRLLASAVVGGPGSDTGSDVARDARGGVYLAGLLDVEEPEDAGTTSLLHGPAGRAFVVRLRPDNSLDYRADLGRGLAEPHIGVDGARRAFAVLSTAGRPDAIPGELTASTTLFRLAADSGALDYQVSFSNSNRTSPKIAVTATGEALVAGTTNAAAFPTEALPAENRRGNYDLYLLRVGPDGDLRWSTRLGGSHYDYHTALASDSRGRAYLAGNYTSPDFPITADLPGENGDAVVARVRPEGAPIPIPIGREGFAELWARSDMPVAAGAWGLLPRGWTWGPGPISHGLPYREAVPRPDDFFFQFFDKGAMASILTYPIQQVEDYASPRLVVEMIDPDPRMDNRSYGEGGPCREAIAGDPAAVNPSAVTYASLRSVAYPVVTARSERRTGALVTATLRPDGVPGDNADLARYGVALGGYDEQLGHNVPQLFLDFLNRQGVIYAGGRMAEGPILGDWARLMGLPLSEPFWISTTVGGVRRDVLVQPFERRVLTYTPANAPPWQVEFGNVGRDYLRCYLPPVD